MKVKISNLGAIKQAEFELGELTIICGDNNTGKSYITHGLYGLLDYLYQDKFFRMPLTNNDLESLCKNGFVHIKLKDYIKSVNEFLYFNFYKFNKELSTVFAVTDEKLENSNIELSLNIEDLKIDTSIGSIIVEVEEQPLTYKSIDSHTLEIRLPTKNKNAIIQRLKTPIEAPNFYIPFPIIDYLIPQTFLSSAERTGASIFQKELDFTRNRLVDVLQTDISIGSQLIGKFSNTYPLAIKKNVDFIREMPLLSKKESYIAQHHPHILVEFADIIGGNYHISQDGDISFQPKGSKQNIRLALHESSSAVRSLLDIGFYLRHVAQKGDLLMVDEPELNLHPQNQRRVARLFAQLINIGIKVFITTHSDYIIKELNTLIMFNQGGKRLESLAKQEGYQHNEFLDPNKVRVYIAEKALIHVDGSKKRKKCNTLVQADIDSEYGIEARSFDTTIEEMNRIQEEIVWGE